MATLTPQEMARPGLVPTAENPDIYDHALGDLGPAVAALTLARLATAFHTSGSTPQRGRRP